MQKSKKAIKDLCHYNKSRGAVLLKDLAANDFEDIWQHMEIQDYTSGQFIIQQGDIAQGFFVVMTGTVKITRVNEDGKQVTIDLLNSGDMCLEDTLFLETPITTNVSAVKNSTVLFVPKSFVLSQLAQNEVLALKFLKTMAKNYRNTLQHIDVLSIKSPLQRVGYYLLLQYLKTGNQKSFRLPFQKQDVANYLGITPETFSRVIRQMGTIGICVENNTVHIKKEDVLCNFCDLDSAINFCPKQNTCDKFCLDCPPVSLNV